MFRKFITQPVTVVVLLIVQVIPLLIFPPDSYSATSQEWWLPALLAILSLVSVYQIVFRRTTILWPWYLLSFAQGFNIISRLMMFMPHASRIVSGKVEVDGLYLTLTVISVIISTAYIYFFELPDVRMSLYSQKSPQTA